MFLLPFLLAGSVVFVDASATGANDGTSWRDAFTDLRTALAGPNNEEVWVAEGTYRPSALGDRSESFFVNNRSIYGGFDGTETTLDQRAGLFDRTILDGDLAGDDGPGFARRGDNSWHVVILGGGTTFDGFTVRGGQADGPNYHTAGGGIATWIGATLEIRDCRIVDNFAAVLGGGVDIDAVNSARFRRCTFERNAAGTEGGAAFTLPMFYEVEFDRCLFLENRSAEGGAVSGWGSFFAGCAFRGNRARGGIGGGAIRMRDTLEIQSCTFVENAATLTREGGGAIHFEGLFFQTPLPVANSVFWRNRDTEGEGFPSQIRLGPSCPHVQLQHSCVPEFHATAQGNGNLRADPELDGDLRPRPGSPCIDRGNDAFLAQLASTDLAGGLRAFDALDCGDGGVLDIGAVESQRLAGTTNYCTAAASSLGVPADLAGPCAWELQAGDVPLSAGPVPPGGGLFFFGPDRNRTPLGDGVLCVGGRLHRTPFVLPTGGFLSASIDLSDPRIAGKLLPGTCWSFQAWYRDAASGGAGFNFSDAIRVTFR